MKHSTLPTRSHLPPAARCGSALPLLAVLAAMLAPATADATPSYGRRYGVSCTTCHAPLPPRLNNFGIVFRKAGFRLPDADDDGKLIFKTVPAHGIADAASLAADVMARRDKEVEEGNRASFELGEVEALAGTAIGEHLSAQAMFVAWDEGMSELENAEVQYNAGSARHQLVARGGLMQTYLWQKANHGSLTLSAPLIFAGRSPVEAEGRIPFGLGANQMGAEVGYLFTGLTEGKLTSTMLTAAVLNGVDAEGERALRNTTGGADVYLQALQLFGSRNTVSGFYYRGRSALEAEQGLEGEEAVDAKQRFERYGLRGNYLLFDRLDLVAGAALGKDRFEPSNTETKNRGLFAEAVVTLAKRWIGAYRFDVFDPDRDAADDAVRAHTVSTTFQADDHLYLTAEYQRRRGPEDENWAVVANARLIY